MAAPPGPMPMPTLVDVELSNLLRGPELASAVESAQARTGKMPMPATMTAPDLDVRSSALSLTWSDFKQRHPEWDAEYWAECRALYAGGKRLLGDPAVMTRLFPQNMYEAADVYKARRQRAHYFPYPGTIIDHLLAGLGTDPLKISFTLVDEKGEAETPSSEAKWWQEWVSDVTDEAERPSDYGLKGGSGDTEDDEGGRSMHRFLVDLLREAMQTRSAWVLADLPSDEELASKPDGPPDPYLCLIPAEQVVDWQCDEKGRLLWAMVMTCESIRSSPKSRRGVMRYTFVQWDAFAWAKYVIDVDPQRPPADTDTFQPTVAKPHGFGRVPLERFVLPEGMYAMGKLHSLAREHFNKRCAMGWAEYRSLYAQLYEFQGPSDGSVSGTDIPEIQSDGGRSTNQVRGIGTTQVRGAGDDARYVGIEPAVFVAARESCNDAMREMHRVMFSMALSANMDKAALQRSGESKQQDHATTAVILDALAALLHPFVRRMFVLASLGRGEPVPPADIQGLESFDVTGVNDAIALAIDVFNGLPQRSALAAEIFLTKTWGTILGDVSQDQMSTIQKQIRQGMAAEELAAAAAAKQAMETDGGNTNPSPAGDPAPEPGKPKPRAKR